MSKKEIAAILRTLAAAAAKAEGRPSKLSSRETAPESGSRTRSQSAQ
jgi:hypothetical protein